MVVVGLTGGIGSGKSTVAAMLELRGAAIVDTDRIAREIVEPPSPVFDQLVTEFGPEIVSRDGRLDRARLAQIVFSDASKRARLTELTHPLIARRTFDEINRYAARDVVVAVAPLLFESGFDRHCDLVIAVLASSQTRRRRLLERGDLLAADVDARMQAQLPNDEYQRRAHVIVHNESDLQALEREVAAAWKAIKKSM